jgi:hypothetical protein
MEEDPAVHMWKRSDGNPLPPFKKSKTDEEEEEEEDAGR